MYWSDTFIWIAATKANDMINMIKHCPNVEKKNHCQFDQFGGKGLFTAPGKLNWKLYIMNALPFINKYVLFRSSYPHWLQRAGKLISSPSEPAGHQ